MLPKPLNSSLFRALLVILPGLLTVVLIAACSDDNPSSSTVVELLISPMTVQDSSVVGVPNGNTVLVKVDSDPIRERARFTFSCDASWIDLSNLSGTNYGYTTDSFSIMYSVAGLPIGSYTDSVEVTCSQASNSPCYVEVNYTVKPQVPQLRIFPARIIYYAATPDEDMGIDTFRVYATNGGHYNYTIDYNADWITLSKTSGTTPDTLEISVDPSSVITGAHVDTLWVDAVDLVNSPQPMACSLYIHPWQLESSLFDNWILYDFEFIDDQTGWAVGLIMDDENWSGYMIETSDGGEQWQTTILTPAATVEKYGLSAVEVIGTEMWIAGQSGIILYSPDLGENWFSQSTGLADTVVDLQDLNFISNQVGWIVGQDGLILKTTDGGDSWVTQDNPASGILRACYFVDENTGWIVGDGSVAMRTIDGGENWLPMVGSFWDSRDVFFVDEGTGWVVGRSGGILFTDDGGVSWTQQTTSFSGGLYSVFFFDHSIGWAGGEDGTVLYTDDGGTTWVAQTTGSVNTIYEVKFMDQLRGRFVGQKSEIRYTNSGGN